MTTTPDPLADFRNFLWYVYQHLGLRSPTDLQYSMAEVLADDTLDRIIIEAFRGVGKSWVTAAFCAWLLHTKIQENPQINIMVVSASKQRADNFTTFLLQILSQVPELRYLLPRPDQRQSRASFDVGPAQPTQTPSVISLGITSSLVGNRADYIIADDVESPNNSATTVMREKLSEAVKEFDAILKPGKGKRIIYLGTPQTEESLYNRLLNEGRGYRAYIWPARYPTRKQREAYGDSLAEYIVARMAAGCLEGAPTEPLRFPEEELIKRELSYGKAGFALQFMLDTTLSDAELYPLKLSDLMVYPLSPESVPNALKWAGSSDYVCTDVPSVGFRGDHLHRAWVDSQTVRFVKPQAVIMAIDPAGRGKDETGWAIVALLNNTMYLLDAGGGRGYEDATLHFLANKAKFWGVTLIIHEPNFGDGMFEKIFAPVLKKIHPCSLKESERSNAQKERRIIDTLEPVMMQHRLVVNQTLFEADLKSTEAYPGDERRTYQLFFQMTRITREKGCLLHDDRVDAVALAVSYFANAMARSSEESLRAQKDKEWDDEIKGFLKFAKYGPRPAREHRGPPRWNRCDG